MRPAAVVEDWLELSSSAIVHEAVAEEFTVAIDVGVSHDTVKGDEDTFGWVEFWNFECVAIPADASGEEASGCAAGGVLFDRASDAPVVREGDGLPCGVIEAWGLGTGGVRFEEAPIGGKLPNLAWA